jgi:hypothetical protein
MTLFSIEVLVRVEELPWASSWMPSSPLVMVLKEITELLVIPL